MQPLAPFDVDIRDFVMFTHCAVDGDVLHDDLSGSVIRINAVGRRVVELCDGTSTLGAVVRAVAEQFGVDRDRVLPDVLAFLESAERLGLIRVRRDLWARVSPAALLHRALHLLSLQATRTERRRYPATAYGCAAATLRATRLPLALALVTAPLMAYVIVVQPTLGPATAAVAAAVPLAVVVFVQTTIWLHELGHLLALPGEARRHAYFTARPLTVTMSFDATSAVNRRLLAIAGPFAGVVACVLASVALTLVDLPDGATTGPLLVALGHLGSLTPWAQDGRLFLAHRSAAQAQDADQ